MMIKTYYNILEISSSASQEEIRNAYRKLAMKFHPDRNQDKDLGESKMKELNFIYSILSNPQKRNWYNSTISSTQEYDNESNFYSNISIFCNEIETIDSRGNKSILKFGDNIYYLVDIDRSIITWKYKSKEYFNLVVKNIFDPQKKEFYSKTIQYDFNKTPLCIAHWGDHGLIIYKEDFESYWLSQASYSQVDKRKGIIAGVFIILLLVIGIYYFYTKISTSPEYYLKKGKTELFEKNDYKNALIHFSKAIELNPSYSDAYCNRALVKDKLNDYKGALQDYDISIKLNFSNTEAYFGRVKAKYYLGDYKGAINDCNKVITLDTNSEILVISYNYSGLAKAYLSDYKGALQDLDRAIKINPSIANTYNNRGYVDGYLGDNEGAIRDYSKAIEYAPSSAEAYSNRGLAKNDSGDYNGALEDFNKAIKLNPYDAISFADRGYTKDNLEDYKGAIHDYDKAIELNPSYVTAYINRGYAKLSLNQKYEACIDFKKAADLGDDKAKELLRKYSND
ncbi:MAG: tetratricopeptide repeat protein [Ignavibacteriaceae bacterium]|nr:tetratricopeptide repeat protein [Ignavibacteriaceae bacterium]